MDNSGRLEKITPWGSGLRRAANCNEDFRSFARTAVYRQVSCDRFCAFAQTRKAKVTVPWPVELVRFKTTSVVQDPQAQVSSIALNGHRYTTWVGVLDSIRDGLFANPQKMVFHFLTRLAAIANGRKLQSDAGSF